MFSTCVSCFLRISCLFSLHPTRALFLIQRINKSKIKKKQQCRYLAKELIRIINTLAIHLLVLIEGRDKGLGALGRVQEPGWDREQRMIVFILIWHLLLFSFFVFVRRVAI